MRNKSGTSSFQYPSSNPWAPRPRTHNIAKICERYGGGGHAVVGAISLKPEEVEKGRAIMREIVAELSL